MIALVRAIVRLVLACLAIIAAVAFGVVMVAVALQVLIWLGIP